MQCVSIRHQNIVLVVIILTTLLLEYKINTVLRLLPLLTFIKINIDKNMSMLRLLSDGQRLSQPITNDKAALMETYH